MEASLNTPEEVIYYAVNRWEKEGILSYCSGRVSEINGVIFLRSIKGNCQTSVIFKDQGMVFTSLAAARAAVRIMKNEKLVVLAEKADKLQTGKHTRLRKG